MEKWQVDSIFIIKVKVNIWLLKKKNVFLQTRLLI